MKVIIPWKTCLVGVCLIAYSISILCEENKLQSTHIIKYMLHTKKKLDKQQQLNASMLQRKATDPVLIQYLEEYINVTKKYILFILQPLRHPVAPVNFKHVQDNGYDKEWSEVTGLPWLQPVDQSWSEKLHEMGYGIPEELGLEDIWTIYIRLFEVASHYSQYKPLVDFLCNSSLINSTLDGALASDVYGMRSGLCVAPDRDKDSIPYINTTTNLPYIDDIKLLALADIKHVTASSTIENYTAIHPLKVSSTLAPQGDNNYDMYNISDHNPKTAWIEGVDGYGIGERIEFRASFNGSWFSDGFIFKNGYGKSNKSWRENSRIKTLKVLMKHPNQDEELLTMLHLQDTPFLQVAYIDSNFSGIFIFEIVDVYPGDKYQDTALSSLYILVDAVW